jgi:hypothetical protein
VNSLVDPLHKRRRVKKIKEVKKKIIFHLEIKKTNSKRKQSSHKWINYKLICGRCFARLDSEIIKEESGQQQNQKEKKNEKKEQLTSERKTETSAKFIIKTMTTKVFLVGLIIGIIYKCKYLRAINDHDRFKFVIYIHLYAI